MKIKPYLDCIGIKQLEDISLQFLEKLQTNHLLAVPFENLDIIQRERIILDENKFYEKIVNKKRGGFCYELNGLFYWLLSEAGFPVSMVSARVYVAATNKFTPEFDHMALLVSLGSTYLVDVGFGDSLRKPVSLPDGKAEDISGNYRIQPPTLNCRTYILQKREKNKWKPVYSFTAQSRRLSDFSDMCVFHQTSPNSPFTQKPVCTIATGEGRITMSGNTLAITEGKTKRRLPLYSAKDYKQMFVKYFGMELSKPLLASLVQNKEWGEEFQI